MQMEILSQESNPINTISSQTSSTQLSDSFGSPKSTDSKRSPTSDTSAKNRRKRKPKKVSQSDCEQINNIHEDVEENLPAANVLNPALNALRKDSKADSDDCETIDKIAKMVSKITSGEAQSMTQPVSENNDIINQVEQDLAQLLGETPSEVVSPPSESLVIAEPEKLVEVKEKPKPKAKAAPRKKKAEVGGKKQKKNQVNGSKAKGANAKNANKNIQDDKKKVKKSNEKSKPLKLDTAPYLQISKDGSFNIVNQTANGDDENDKSSSKPKKTLNTEKHKVGIRGLHVSTLSNKYDADKRDTTWICVFCKLGPHKFKLGDLFGPYVISKVSKEYSLCLEDPANDIFRQGNHNKFKPIVHAANNQSPTKKKRKNSEKLASPVNVPEKSDEVNVFNGMTQVDENNMEVWFHEDCIVWAPGTHIIGSQIRGMEAAVWQSTRHQCCSCQKNGAMIACLARGCKKESHIICARKSWKLSDDFKTFCEQHTQLQN
jgi:hypothetical protein